MPIRLRNAKGDVIEVPDDAALGYFKGQGYEPETLDQTYATTLADAAKPEDRGVIGSINAAATGLLSGATLGLSDVALSGLLDDGQRERLHGDRAANPVISGVSQVVGGVAPILAAPGTLLGSTPAGIVGRASAAGFEAGRAAGGLAGVAQAAGATAAEGALQSAGAYLADTALADRKLSAEGMFGAIGLGATFGAAAGGAMLGIERGTIAARRMFARTANADKAAAEAEAAWQAAHQSTIEANDTAAEVAKAKLAQARVAREQADLAKQQAGAFEADVRSAATDIDAYRQQFAGDIAAREQQLQRLALPAGPDIVPAPPSPAKLQELAEAVAEHDAARIDLDDLLRRLDVPDIEPGVASQVTVPRGQFDDLSQRGPLAQGTPVDVTTVGKKLSEGTPTGFETTAFDSKDLGLVFDPKQRVYHDPSRVGREAEKFAPSEPVTGLVDRPSGLDDIVRMQREAGQSGARSIDQVKAEYDDVIRRIDESKDVKVRRDLGKQRDALSDELDALGDYTPAVAQAKPESAGPQPIAPGKTINELKHPDETASNFVLRRMREQGETFGDPSISDKKFLGSLGIDWTIPENKAVMMKMMRDGDAQFARADLVGAMDPTMVKASEIIDGADKNGFGGQRWHFIRDTGQPVQIPKAVTAPVADDPLLSALRATGSQLDSGAQLGKLSRESPAAAEYATKKLAKRADGAAYFRAKNAKPTGLEGALDAQRLASKDVAADDFFSQLTKPKTRDQYVAQNIGRAMREEGNHAAGLARLEREWAAMGGAPAARTVADDVTSAADVITKYERAAAKLTEALGPEAPPAAQQAAKAFRDAEVTVDRKTIERTTRAVDDHAEPPRPKGIKGGPTLSRSQPKPVFGDVPLPPSSREMLDAAKARKLDADAAFKRARVAETEAKIGARQAQETADATRAAAEAVRPASPAPGGESKLGTLAAAAGVADFADVLGIPGIPQPSDIPIIGPLLGVYLKFKALKFAAGRFTGRVAATGDTKAAALAARTKERMAEAVDRTLGLVEKAAPKSRALAVAATTQLNRRLFDDGEPDAPKGASVQDLAAVRIREIAAAVIRPDLVSRQVAREFRGVTDPDLLAAAEAHLMARFEYLNRVSPKAPPPNPFSKREWKPSPMAAHDLAQRLSVINDPASAFVDPTPAKAETVKAVYPALLKMAQEWLIERVADTKHPVPYESRLRNSLLFDVPLDDSLQPDHAAVLATAHAPSPVTDAAPVQPGPPQSSIAANTNLSSVYRTGTERRAL